MSRCVVKRDCYCEILDFILGTKGKKSSSTCFFLFYKCALECWVEIICSAFILFLIIEYIPLTESVFSVNWTSTELVYWKTDTCMYKHISIHSTYRYINTYPHIRGLHADIYYTHLCTSCTLPFRTHYLPVLDETLKAVGCERFTELPSKPLPGHITGLCLKSWKNNLREEMPSLISEMAELQPDFVKQEQEGLC